MTGERKPMVLLTTVWERTSAAGRKYYSGFLGNSQLLMFDDGDQPHPTRPGETVHVWKVLLQERDQAPRQQSPTRTAERGQAVWDRGRDKKAAQGQTVQTRQTGPGSYEPDFYDDSAAAISDLEGGGR